MIVRVLALLMLVSLTPPASAQSLDGTYSGTIGCLSRGGLRPLQTPLRMTVSGEAASYEREILSPGSNCPGGCPTGNFERGTGTVSSSGEVTLRGKAEGKGARGSYAFESEYQGQLRANPIRLAGVQRWVVDGRAEPDRSCEINLSPPKS